MNDVDCNVLISDFSQAIGADPNSVVEVATEVINENFNNALDFIEKHHGVDPDKLIEYVSQNGSKQFKRQLLTAAYYNNDLSIIKDLVRAYKQKTVI